MNPSFDLYRDFGRVGFGATRRETKDARKLKRAGGGLVVAGTRREIKDARKLKRGGTTTTTTGNGTNLPPACETSTTLGACLQCCSHNLPGAARRACKRNCDAKFSGGGGNQCPAGQTLNAQGVCVPITTTCNQGYCQNGYCLQPDGSCCPRVGMGPCKTGPELTVCPSGSHLNPSSGFPGACISDCPAGQRLCADGVCRANCAQGGDEQPPEGNCRLNCGAGAGGVQCRYICDDYRSWPGTTGSGTMLPPPGTEYYEAGQSGYDTPAETATDGITQTLQDNWKWIGAGALLLLGGYWYTHRKGVRA